MITKLKTSYKAMLLPFVLLLWSGLIPAAELAEAQKSQAITALLAKAERALAEDRLTVPSGDNAVAYAQEVLDLSPEHPVAQRILRDVVSRYGMIADSALDRAEAVVKQELRKARTYRTRGERVAEKYSLPEGGLRPIDKRIAFLDQRFQPSLDGRIQHPLDRGVLARAVQQYSDRAKSALVGGNISEARRYHDIAQELAKNYQVRGAGLAGLNTRIAEAEGARSIAQGVVGKAEELDLASEFGPVFIPPAF